MIGMLFYVWMYVALFRYSLRQFRTSTDPMVRALSIGFAAAMIGVAFSAFLSTLLEIRTLAFYLWLYGDSSSCWGSRGCREGRVSGSQNRVVVCCLPIRISSSGKIY